MPRDARDGLIRDAVIHLSNEQPLVADLFAVPASTDSCLVCTNVRTLGGKRPVSVDRSDSIFLFPLIQVRFVEVPATSAAAAPGLVGPGGGAPGARPRPEPEPELEIDEDLIRRVREA